MIPVNNSCINKRSNNFRNTYLRNIVEEILRIYIYSKALRNWEEGEKKSKIYIVLKNIKISIPLNYLLSTSSGFVVSTDRC